MEIRGKKRIRLAIPFLTALLLFSPPLAGQAFARFYEFKPSSRRVKVSRKKITSASRRTTRKVSRGTPRNLVTSQIPQSTIPRDQLISFALSLQGRSYRRGGSGPNYFDCSGFTMYCYQQVGISLPHSSRAQFGCGVPVADGELQPGDLVFFGGGRITHVGIYVGDGNFIHAPETGEVVRVQPLSSHGNYRDARRL